MLVIIILKRVFQSFGLKAQNSYFVEHLSMVTFVNILRKNNISFLKKMLTPSEKPVYAPVYSLFEI